MSPIGSTIRMRAEEAPERPAISSIEGGVLSRGELSALITARGLDLLRHGIQSSDRVAIVLENGPAAATCFLTVASVATAAPLNPSLTEAEYEFYLEDLDARALIVASNSSSASVLAARRLGIETLYVQTDRGSNPGLFVFDDSSSDQLVSSPLRSLPDRDWDSTVLVLHTSGTTARPKIVPLTNGNLARSAGNVAQTLSLSHQDKCLNVMPLFHIHGLVAALLASLHAGASLICAPGFRATEFLRWLADHQPTWYSAVPTMHQAILERLKAEGSPNHKLRFVRSSSASLAPSIIEGLELELGVPVVEAYGMTEAAHQMTSNPLGFGIRKVGSVGPAAGPEVAIADETGAVLRPGEVGEVVIRGDNVSSGYHGFEDLSSFFHDGGWFRTGDQGYMDEDGYLFLTGRLKEIINRGGETIAPRQIDEALLALDGVRQAVAFAVPDPALGEEVAAAVILEEGSSLTEASIKEALSESMSVARIPKRVLFVDAIPKGPSGKLQRIGLADRLGIDGVRDSTTRSKGSIDTVAAIASIWQETLRLDEVEVDQPFLESGGDSLTAASLAVAIEKRLNVKLPILDFYNAATVEEQAALVDELRIQGSPNGQ